MCDYCTVFVRKEIKISANHNSVTILAARRTNKVPYREIARLPHSMPTLPPSQRLEGCKKLARDARSLYADFDRAIELERSICKLVGFQNQPLRSRKGPERSTYCIPINVIPLQEACNCSLAWRLLHLVYQPPKALRASNTNLSTSLPNDRRSESPFCNRAQQGQPLE